MAIVRLRSEVRRPWRVGAVLVVGALAVLAGCSNGGDGRSLGPLGPLPSPSVRAAGPLVEGNGLQPYGDATWPAYAASPRSARLAVAARPGGPTVRTMANRLPLGAPLTLLVVGKQTGWVQVELPVRPNGTTGWVRASDVRLTGLRYGLVLERGAHRLQLFDRDTLRRTYSVGIGTRETPTPGGLYYLIELLRPPDPSGPYGPYAYGLSGFSTVIKHFNGGDGVIGLHGTNDPAGIGHDVSHGCIRLHNADITYLARMLPLGTPIRILA